SAVRRTSGGTHPQTAVNVRRTDVVRLPDRLLQRRGEVILESSEFRSDRLGEGPGNRDLLRRHVESNKRLDPLGHVVDRPVGLQLERSLALDHGEEVLFDRTTQYDVEVVIQDRQVRINQLVPEGKPTGTFYSAEFTKDLFFSVTIRVTRSNRRGDLLHARESPLPGRRAEPRKKRRNHSSYQSR